MKDDCGQKTVNIHLDKDNQPFLFFFKHIQRSVRLLTPTLTEYNRS